MSRFALNTAIAACVALFLLPHPAAAQDEKPPPEKEIRALIEQLGADSYEERKAAHQKLLETGEAAEPYLREALNHPDLEVRIRVEDILRRMKWHLPAAVKKLLEPEIVDKLETFQEQEPQERRNLLNMLVNRAPVLSVSFCIRVLLYEKDSSVLGIAAGNVSKNATVEDIPGLEKAVEARKNYLLLRTLADLLVLDGKIKEAVTAYEQAHEMKPDDSTIVGKLAALYRRAEMWDKSAKLYTSILQKHPGNIPYIERLGEALWRQDKKDEALRAWQDIVKKNPTSEIAYIKLADILVQYGLPDRAVPVLEEGMEKFKVYRFPMRLAAIAVGRGDKDAAAGYLHSARATASREYELVSIHDELFKLFPSDKERRKLLDAAMAGAKEAEAEGDNRLAVIHYFFAAELAGRLKLHNEQIAALEKIENLLDEKIPLEFHGVRDRLLALYRARKMWDKAITVYEKHLKKKWNNQYNAELGHACFEKGDREKAKAVWKQQIAGEREKRPDCHDRYIRLLLDHELYAEARDAAGDSLKLWPHIYAFRLLFGIASLKLGDVEAALKAFDELLEKNPNSQHYVGEIVRALKEAGKLKEAEKFLAEAAEKEALILAKEFLENAKTAETNKKRDEAIALYKMVITAAPDSDYAKEARERLKILESLPEVEALKP